MMITKETTPRDSSCLPPSLPPSSAGCLTPWLVVAGCVAELGSRLLQVDGKSMLDTVLSASGQAATGGLTTMMKALAA